MRTFIIGGLAALTPTLALAEAHGAPLAMAMHYNQDQAAPLLACLADYEAETGQAVEYQQVSYGEYLQTVLTGRIGGTQPDIYHLYSIWGAQMADNGVLAEPPADLADYIRETYGETADAATIDGTLYGVPTEVSVYMLVSNMALLREAGYDAPPATWEELREIAGAITTRNDQGRVETAGFAFADSSSGAGVVHPFYTLLASRGAEMYADDFSEANLDGPEAAAAAADMAGLVEDGITDISVDGYDFPAGGIGMIVMANWMKSSIEEGLGSLDDVAVSPIPMGDDWRTLSYSFFMGVDSESENQEAAWALVRWLNSDESADESGVSCMGRMLTSLGALTANSADNAAMGEADAFTQPFVDALAEGRAVGQPNVMQAAEIEGMMAEAIDTVIAGDAEAGTAMEELDGRVEDVLFEFY